MIPNIISNFSKLRSDPKPTVKLILKKYIQASLNLAFVISAPGPIVCLVMKTTGRLTWVNSLLTWMVGSFAVFFEPVSRHVTYAGYFGPKAIEIFLNSLENRKLIKQTKLRGLIVLFLASAILGLAASRGHCARPKEGE